MTEFVLRYWLEVAFAAVVSLFGVTLKRMRTYIGNQQALAGGVQALLRDRIIQAYNHYSAKGYCPIYAKENIEAMYKQYKTLGGNGTITNLMDALQKMPTEKGAGDD